MSVEERYAFSAFGIRSIMAGDFTSRANSSFSWEFAFQGQFEDAETGYLNYGYRYYAPETGRWLSRDPIAERGGRNLYAFVDNRPVNGVDMLGLAPPKRFLSDKMVETACKCVDLKVRYTKTALDQNSFVEDEEGNPIMPLIDDDTTELPLPNDLDRSKFLISFYLVKKSTEECKDNFCEYYNLHVYEYVAEGDNAGDKINQTGAAVSTDPSSDAARKRDELDPLRLYKRQNLW